MKKTVVYVFACLLCVVCIAQAGTTPTQDVQGGISLSGEVSAAAVTVTASNSISIHWTAPADSINRVDSSGNTVVEFNGAATMYEIAYSLTPIDSQTAGNAPSILDSSFIPSNPGETEEYLVVGLNPGTTYYFAVRAADATYYNPNVAPYEPVNWSGWSNVVSKTTPIGQLTGTDFEFFLRDMNADGLEDAVIWETTIGSIYIGLRDPQTDVFIWDNQPVISGFCRGTAYHRSVKDMNNDGYPDAIGHRSSNGGCYIARFDRIQKKFVYSGTPSIMGFCATTEYKMFFEDINGDFFPDLIGRKLSNGGWYVAFNNQNLTFTYPGSPVFVGFCATDAYVVDVVDVNGDGYFDFAGQRQSNGGWYFLINDRDNTFSYPGGPLMSGFCGSADYIPKFKDWNNDGYVDLSGYKKSSSAIYIAYNQKNLSFYYDKTPAIVGFGDSLGVIESGLVTGDSLCDAVYYNKTAGNIEVAQQSALDVFQLRAGPFSGYWITNWGICLNPAYKVAGTDEPTDAEVSDGQQFADIGQNYPNPFNPMTTISYTIPEASHVSLEILNILGQRVETLVDEQQAAGEHSVQWNAGQYATGVYFYRFTVGTETKTKKMLLIK